MQPQFNSDEYNNAKMRDKIKCKCIKCEKDFLQTKRTIYVTSFLRKNDLYCSNICFNSNRNRVSTKKYNCFFCKKEFYRKDCEIKKSKNLYCSTYCAAKYNSTHRKNGTKRSKLEKWLEIQLKKLYPNLNILYNSTSAIECELDIFIPELRLAFELNGIFHYEPIYGLEKLTNTQQRDKRKILTCAEKKIELCIIDVSKHKYFKEKSCEPFLDIIISIIKNRNI